MRSRPAFRQVSDANPRSKILSAANRKVFLEKHEADLNAYTVKAESPKINFPRKTFPNSRERLAGTCFRTSLLLF